MKFRKTTRMLLVAAPLLAAVLGFQSSTYVLTRNFSKTAVLTNSQILVTVNFTNNASVACRGFYYSDGVPSGLTVSTVSVRVNAQTVTNYVFESGQCDDVYPGCTPCRWVLEQPTNFAGANPVPPQAPVQLVYAITATTSNAFNLPQFSWGGFEASRTNAVFGYSDDVEQRCVIFTTPALMVSVQPATNGFRVGLNGMPDTNYVIDTASNFYNWVPLVTNAAPFYYTDTNPVAGRTRYYRGRRY
jgi:uncharacterized repeat protein (TIGR01451 family)